MRGFQNKYMKEHLEKTTKCKKVSCLPERILLQRQVIQCDGQDGFSEAFIQSLSSAITVLVQWVHD